MRKVITTGICVSPGFVKGRSRIVKTTEDVYKAEPGEVLILPNSHPMFAIAVMNASAVVCENGGKLSHICIVAMEMGIPCITQAAWATDNVISGQQVCVDAEEGVVYVDE